MGHWRVVPKVYFPRLFDLLVAERRRVCRSLGWIPAEVFFTTSLLTDFDKKVFVNGILVAGVGASAAQDLSDQTGVDLVFEERFLTEISPVLNR